MTDEVSAKRKEKQRDEIIIWWIDRMALIFWSFTGIAFFLACTFVLVALGVHILMNSGAW